MLCVPSTTYCCLQMVWGFGRALGPDERGRRGAGVLFGLGLMAVGWLGWAAARACCRPPSAGSADSSPTRRP